MKNSFFFLVALFLFACSTSKKVATNTVPPQSQPSTTTAPFPLVLPVNAFPEPGNDELIALQTQFKTLTLEQLKEGHTIYTKGACTNCHGAKTFSEFETAKWKEILDDMAPKAYLSEAQKDAVYKYVLAMKTKESK